MIDKVFKKIAESLGTNLAIVLFAIIAFAPLTMQLPQTPIEWQQWLSQTCIQLIALAILQKGTRMEGERTNTLLQETHDYVTSELAEIKGMHVDIHRAMVLEKHTRNKRSTDSGPVTLPSPPRKKKIS